MKTRLTITAAAATATLLGTLGLSTGASAAVTPVMDAHDNGWSHMVRSPHMVNIGNGGAPFITRLTWQHWGGAGADGTGKLYVQHNPRCEPTYRCRNDVYNVRVWMHRVITHRGSEVFSRMRWTYGRAGHVLRLRVTRIGDWDY